MILQGCSPVTVGGSYRLIRLWSPGLIKSLAHSLFSASLHSQSISCDGQALEQVLWLAGPQWSMTSLVGKWLPSSQKSRGGEGRHQDGTWPHIPTCEVPRVNIVPGETLKPPQRGSPPNSKTNCCVSQTLPLNMLNRSSSFNAYVRCMCTCAKSLQSGPTLCDPTDYSPPGSSAHGILQARILEWVAIFSSRGSFWPTDQTCISCIIRRVLHHWATKEAHVECGSVLLYTLFLQQTWKAGIAFLLQESKLRKVDCMRLRVTLPCRPGAQWLWLPIPHSRTPAAACTVTLFFFFLRIFFHLFLLVGG